ncbi:ran GTPase-activating protein 1-like [Montipora capricornis]|uniref:ran GTPase-activating protein 1-like n=1 Tax=Montipora capricornis TaxID=246305 RepID=UPI0035F12CB4
MGNLGLISQHLNGPEQCTVQLLSLAFTSNSCLVDSASPIASAAPTPIVLPSRHNACGKHRDCEGLSKGSNIGQVEENSNKTKVVSDCGIFREFLTDAEKIARFFVSVCVTLRNDEDSLLECSDAILKTTFESSECKEEGLVSFLLIHMGLLKGEEKIESAKDISGPLMALDHAAKQPYFPRHLKAFFIAFISKPNKLLESCSEERHKFLQTLYQI